MSRHCEESAAGGRRSSPIGGLRFLVLLSALGLGVIHAADPFEPYDRFSLSTQYLEAVRENLLSPESPPLFLSLPELNPAANPGGWTLLRGGSDSLRFSASFFALGALSRNSTGGFAMATPWVDYQSPHLRLHFRSDILTTGGVPALPLPGTQPERIFSDVEHLKGLSTIDMSVYEAYLEFPFKNLTVSTGKKKLRWGPGYRGTLILSGTAPAPIFFYNANVRLFDRLSYSTFFAGLDDEALFKTEWRKSKYRKTPDLNPPARYLAGHKLDFQFTRNFQAGFNEMAVLYGTADITRFANPVHPVYLGNLRSETNNANLIMSIDYSWTCSPFRYYGELLNDDITVFDATGNPDKFAIQQGLVRYFKSGAFRELGFEYTHVHHFVFGHSRVMTRYVYWNEPLGWPYGNDQDLAALYGRLWFWEGALELRPVFSAWLKGSGLVTDDWYMEGSPKLNFTSYWVKNGKMVYQPELTARYRLLRRADLTARVGAAAGPGRKPAYLLQMAGTVRL